MKIKIAIAFAFFALMPATASAESQNDQNACMNDAFNVCGQAIPDRSRVAPIVSAGGNPENEFPLNAAIR